MKFYGKSSEESEEEWVNVRSRHIDEDQAVVAELGVNPEETIRELQEDPDVWEITWTMDPTYDGPFDLLWLSGGHWAVVPRNEWSPKIYRVIEMCNED